MKKLCLISEEIRYISTGLEKSWAFQTLKIQACYIFTGVLILGHLKTIKFPFGKSLKGFLPDMGVDTMLVIRPRPFDGWMTCNFTSLSKVFQSYQEDGQVIMKGYVQ